jgi:hypothetical protein
VPRHHVWTGDILVSLDLFPANSSHPRISYLLANKLLLVHDQPPIERITAPAEEKWEALVVRIEQRRWVLGLSCTMDDGGGGEVRLARKKGKTKRGLSAAPPPPAERGRDRSRSGMTTTICSR